MDIIKDILNRLKNNRKVIMLVCSIALVITILINSTYSLLVKTDETNAMTYSTGNLQITSNSIDNSVTLTNSLPMTDEDGMNSTPFTFEITNVGNLTFEFKIKLLSTTSENLIEAQYIKISVNGNEPVTLASLTKGVILEDVTLKPIESKKITLRVWLDINTPNTQIGKVFNAKLVTEGQAVYDYVSFTPGIDNSGANFPQLTDGLIPVVYDEEIMEWVRADTSIENGWYNYDEKKWANAVLVKEVVDSVFWGANQPFEDFLWEPFDSSTTYYSTSNGESLEFKFYDDESGSFNFNFELGVLPGVDDYSTNTAYRDLVEEIDGYQATYCNEHFQVEVDGVVYPCTYWSNPEVSTSDEFARVISGFYNASYNNDVSEHIVRIHYVVNEIGGTYIKINDVRVPGVSSASISVNRGIDWSTSSYYTPAVEYYVSDSYSLSSDSELFELTNPVSVNSYQISVGSYICDFEGGTICSSLYKVIKVNSDTGIAEEVAALFYDGNYYRDSLFIEDSAGIIISGEDILAHYVWIPRFKYKVWNINKEIGVDSYDAQTTGIDIVFENGTSTTGDVRCTYDFGISATNTVRNEECTGTNGESYYTHPAFTFGEDELTGFWMGKYEISSTMQECLHDTGGTYSECSGGERSDLTPRILPNVFNWAYNSVDNYKTVIRNMQVNNNIYGLSTNLNVVDSYMITNMEWGAVAYLTNSDYGICSDGVCDYVEAGYIDGYDFYAYEANVTGSGGSTTGNVYGVYDMHGGAEEIVSVDFSTSDLGKGVTTYAIKPESFELAFTQDAFNASRLGDAIGEVVSIDVSKSDDSYWEFFANNNNGTTNNGWNGSYVNFLYDIYFYRRGGSSAGLGAGYIYDVNSAEGSFGEITGTRAALVVY